MTSYSLPDDIDKVLKNNKEFEKLRRKQRKDFEMDLIGTSQDFMIRAVKASEKRKKKK